jgi:hypothetical protein
MIGSRFARCKPEAHLINPETPPEKTAPARSVARRILILLVSLIPWLVTELLASQKVMLAPPHHRDTLTLYPVLWLIGLVTVWIGSLVGGVKTWQRIGLNLARVGVIAVVVMFILLGLNGRLFGASLAIWANFSDCRAEPLPDSQILYTCPVTEFYPYTLEGPSGSPFARLISEGAMITNG